MFDNKHKLQNIFSVVEIHFHVSLIVTPDSNLKNK